MEKIEGRPQGLVACPAYGICADYGTARPSCRYDPEALPVGMSTYDPEDAWCTPGIVTLVLMVAEQMGIASDKHR